ncbi:MAG: thiamine phosphate synthase [Deltaproteobacteria bacterium]
MAVIDFSLYMVTDRDLLGGRNLIEEVKKAIKGGVTAVQLREKKAGAREFYQMALALKQEMSGTGVPLIINDRLDIALASGADGLHIGQEDLPLQTAAAIMPAGSIIGLSVNSELEAREGARHGASYLGVGPVFQTTTKEDARSPIGLEGLRNIKEKNNIPLVAIGGINEDNVTTVKNAGAEGVAVVSALMGAPDIETAARRLIRLWRES